jgi:hypothetical protein
MRTYYNIETKEVEMMKFVVIYGRQGQKCLDEMRSNNLVKDVKHGGGIPGTCGETFIIKYNNADEEKINNILSKYDITINNQGTCEA